MTRTISPATLNRSRTAETVIIDPDEGSGRETPLARMSVDESEARSWRVTLGRADRRDGRSPLVRGTTVNASSPIFNSQIFGYCAGAQNTPQDPPVRDNRVASDGNDVDPIFVEIAWGMSVGQAHRLIANWPLLGGTVELYGSYVEVFAGTFLAYGVSETDDCPKLTASIAPADGVTVGASAELSIQQQEPITVGYAAAGDPAVLYVPDFAREVRVVLVDGATNRPFDSGHPRCNLEWFDDQGPTVIDAWAQGSSIGVAPSWQRVPAQATMLRIGTPGANIDCNETPFTQCVAMVHWRVAP